MFLMDDSAAHESKHTLIQVSFQEHRHRYLVSVSHSLWWKAVQVTDFCHSSETNTRFDSTIGWIFMCFCVSFFFMASLIQWLPAAWHTWARQPAVTSSFTWSYCWLNLSKKKLLQRRETLQPGLSICLQTKEANSHILYVKNTIWLQVYFLIIFYCQKICLKLPDLKSEANAKVL